MGFTHTLFNRTMQLLYESMTSYFEQFFVGHSEIQNYATFIQQSLELSERLSRPGIYFMESVEQDQPAYDTCSLILHGNLRYCITTLSGQYNTV